MTAHPTVSVPVLADKPPAQDERRQGRIPLHLRVGVTGHRDIDVHAPGLLAEIRDNLHLVESRCPKGTSATPVSLTVVSALAEGADRVVAWQAIECGVDLEAVLPLPAENYLTDFKSDSSRSEFRLLLKKAAAVTELPKLPAGHHRDEAYERVGRAVVDRSDVLLALWDGHEAQGRGGTADIVAYAREQRVPILQVPVKRLEPGSLPAQGADEPKPPEFFGLLSSRAFELLERYNSDSLLTKRKVTLSPLLRPDPKAVVPDRARCLASYAQPYFNRADQVAGSLQWLFRRMTLLLYALSAAAVILVATQIIFFPKYPEIVWAEAAALATVVVTLIIGRLTRLHDRWLAARYLAERIRSGVFLAAVGVGDLRPANGERQPVDSSPPDPDQERVEGAAALPGRWAGNVWLAVRNLAQLIRAAVLSSDDVESPDSAEPDANQEWVEHAFQEIYWRAPRSSPPRSELDALRALLIEAWIEGQLGYHRKTSKDMSRRQLQLSLLAVFLFGLSALAALFHSLDLFPSANNPDFLGYFSVIIPAIGAAIAGYSAQREFARLAQRSRQMISRLNEAKQQVQDAKDLPSLQHAAFRTGLLMRTETADWYAVFRLRDFELPA